MNSETWRKSTYSGGEGGQCVEVAGAPGRVLVRDTKQEGRVGRAVVQFTPAAWRAFLGTLR